VNALANLSVKTKLTAITMVAAGVALFLAGAAMVAHQLFTFREEKVTRLSTQAEIVGSNAASALLFDDPRSAAATLAALRAEPRVVSARIHKPDGTVFARYDRDDGGSRAPPAGLPPPAGHSFGDEGLLVSRPIVAEGMRVGTVVILSDLAEMTAMLRRYGLILLVVFLVSLAMAQLTASRLHRMITAPVLGLVETAKAVSTRRDYSARAVAGGDDELGLLVRSFNEMLGEIQERDAALLRARDELEGQVADRTRSLQGEIAERKVLEEELRAKNRELEEQSRRVQEATRLKSEFLANMSHELRTPLNAIIGFAELMHDGKVGPVSPLHKECLDDILTSSRHLLQLINDVLDLSKVEAGKMEFRPEPLSLERLAGEVRDILRGLAAQKRIRLAVEVDPALGEIVLDAGKLKQVLYNFLSNALKFTAEGGHVTLRARAEGADRFRVEVEDDGIGIRPEDLDRLFAEFQQLDSSAAKTYAGTGLGLALTKRIVEAQGGRVGVSSVHGRGSVFHAILPRVSRAVAEGPAPLLRAPRGGAPTLLVVEDDTRERGWLVETLSAAGYTVEVAATGAAAIERCGERAFDGITLDLLLPDMGGWEVLKAIRAAGPNQATPVVVVTVVVEKGVGAGYAIHDYLAKPVRAEELLASLRRAGLRPATGRPILVVDDDPQARRLMETMLTALGYVTIEATGGEEALALAQREVLAAVILDLFMPGMDGFGFLEHFRGLAAGQGTPVIVWTGRDLTAADHDRLAASAQAVVMKGGTARLIEELRTHVANRAARAGDDAAREAP
jgi:signal transduction histidine kinase/DNA-binding response OmpR family regulator